MKFANRTRNGRAVRWVVDEGWCEGYVQEYDDGSEVVVDGGMRVVCGGVSGMWTVDPYSLRNVVPRSKWESK
jgi:hypothetical protein